MVYKEKGSKIIDKIKMFETSYKQPLPGYTGHIQGRIEEDFIPPESTIKKQIPGTFDLRLI